MRFFTTNIFFIFFSHFIDPHWFVLLYAFCNWNECTNCTFWMVFFLSLLLIPRCPSFIYNIRKLYFLPQVIDRNCFVFLVRLYILRNASAFMVSSRIQVSSFYHCGRRWIRMLSALSEGYWTRFCDWSLYITRICC